MILLMLHSWQYVRSHFLRTVLTTSGNVLGVAVFVGMHTANQSVLAAFSQTIDALGAINLYYILQVVHRDVAGMRLDYQFPVPTVLALVPTMLTAAFLAAVWPAEVAVHVSLLEALEYE